MVQQICADVLCRGGEGGPFGGYTVDANKTSNKLGQLECCCRS